MSRYELVPKNPDHTVAIGWDSPLNTLFMTVIDTTKDEDDEDRYVMLIPNSGQTVHDVDSVITVARIYAEVDKDLSRKLYSDMD